MEFISYSRKDTAFVRDLSEALKQAGHEVWVDWEDIPPTADWWEEISKGIRSANSFIFIISPDSVHSEVCRSEIEHAVASTKRFVPILYRDLVEEKDKGALHPTISSHNWIFLRDTDPFDEGLNRLVTALQTDLEHVNEHTRLLVRAVEWDEHGRDNSFLLNGSEIVRAESWLSSGMNKKPEPSVLHSDYIFTSRQHQTRRQRTLLIGTVIGLIVAITLAIISLILYGVADAARTHAENSEATAVVAQGLAEAKSNLAASLALAANARNLRNEDNPNLALALALEAYKVNQPAVADVQQTLANTIYEPAARYRRQGHTGSIMDVDFSPDGRIAVSVALDGRLIARDALNGAEISAVYIGPAASVAFSPDNRTVAVGLLAGPIALVDVETGVETGRLTGHSDYVTTLQFTPDGAQLVSGGLDRTVRVWDIADGQAVQTIDSPGVILKLALDSDGARVVTGSGDRFFDANAPGNVRDRTVRVWDLATGEQLHRFDPESGFVRAVAFSHDGEYVLSGTWNQSESGKLQLWSLADDQPYRFFYGPTNIVSDVMFDADYPMVIASSWDGSIRFWDIETALQTYIFQGHADRVQAMAMHPSGEYILAGTGNTGPDLPTPATDRPQDVSLWLWDLLYRGEILTLQGHENWVWSVDYSPDGAYAASGSGPLNLPARDTSVRLWDLSTGEQVAHLQGHSNTVSGVAFNRAGTLLASSGWDGTVRLWPVEISADGIQAGESRVGLDAGDVRVNSVMFSADGSQALSALGDGTIALWDVDTGDIITRFEGHERAVNSAVFSPDERYVLSGSDDITVRLWDAASGALLRTFEEAHRDRVNGVAFSPDGTRAVSTSWDTSVRLWDVETGQEIRQFVGHSGAVFSVAFSQDGQMILTGSADQSVRLWEVETGQEIRQLNGHTNWILSVKFSPDGTTALSGAEDDTVRLWRADTLDNLIAWGLENRYVPVLSCAQRLQYNVEPFCDETGILPTPTITPTPRPATATPPPESATDEPAG
jgi:WD40 repeat protein